MVSSNTDVMIARPLPHLLLPLRRRIDVSGETAQPEGDLAREVWKNKIS